jgi:hypothetical protein
MQDSLRSSAASSENVVTFGTSTVEFQNGTNVVNASVNQIHDLASPDCVVPKQNFVRVTAAATPRISADLSLDSSQWTAANDTSVYAFHPTLNCPVGLHQSPVFPTSYLTQRCVFPVDYVAGAQQPTARRAITAKYKSFPQRQTSDMVSNYRTLQNWNPNSMSWSPNQQSQTWLGAGVPQQHQRRSVPNLNTISPAVLKNVQHPMGLQQQSVFAPSKFRRSTSFSGQPQAVVGMQQINQPAAYDDLTMQKDGFQVCSTITCRH